MRQGEGTWAERMLVMTLLRRSHRASLGRLSRHRSLAPLFIGLRRWLEHLIGVDLDPGARTDPVHVEPWLDTVLTPLQDGHARCVPVRARVFGARNAAVVPTRLSETAGVCAWALLFAPSDSYRSGADEPYLLLLTPIWPATHLSDRDCEAILERASEVHGWGVIKDDGAAPSTTAVVAIDAGTAHPGRSVTAYASSSSQWRATWVEAEDVASCLGWPGLPAWPRATNTREFCTAWAPGSDPLVVRVPADAQRRWAAARRLLHATTPERDMSRGYAQVAYFARIDRHPRLRPHTCSRSHSRGSGSPCSPGQ